MITWSEKLSRPAYDDFGADQQLEPIFSEASSLLVWETRQREIRDRWTEVLGTPALGYEQFDRQAKQVDAFDLPECYATLYQLPTSPETQQQVLLMRPKEPPKSPCPGAVIPFYDPDRMAGYDLQTKVLKEDPGIHFGRHLVQQGYVVLCGQAFPYNTVPDPGSKATFSWWHAGTEKVLGENPDWTGMGKLIWDTRLATDFLLEQPDVDPERIILIGHSLGGKMAFYNGCLDDRIAATIASDFGIGFDSTNWDAPWYLGEWVDREDLGVAHHHLLALHAPRPFLIVAGQYDGPVSWQYLQAASVVYRHYEKEDAVGMLDHASGHRPTEEAMRGAYRWLAEQMGLPETSWEL